MADETAKPTPAAKAGKLGVEIPFDTVPEEKHPGVDPETNLFQGIHPETKERMSVTLEGLKAEFGPELGEKKYLKIAGVGGGSQFFNPGTEASTYRPPLGIFQLPAKYKAEVDKILAAKE